MKNLTRIQKIEQLKAIQKGIRPNAALKAICVECLPLIDSDQRAALKTLLSDPFASTDELYEIASDSLLSRMIDVINAATSEEIKSPSYLKIELDVSTRLIKFKP